MIAHMNIIVDISNLNLNGMFFLDKRTNVIIDGYFSRLVYSTPDFVMNGLYLKCGLYKSQEVTGLIRQSNSYNQFSSLCTSEPKQEGFRPIIHFDLKNTHNLKNISEMCSLEESILNQYKEVKSSEKICVYNLRNQLYTGSLKLSGPTSHSLKTEFIKLIIKLSGIWETDNSVGITFKFHLQ
jgi:hypothetical protein